MLIKFFFILEDIYLLSSNATYTQVLEGYNESFYFDNYIIINEVKIIYVWYGI